MKRTMIIVAALSVAACSAPKTDAPSKADAAAQNAATSYAGDFETMEFPTTTFTTPLAAATALIGNFPESAEGDPNLNVQIVKDTSGKATFLIQATAKGFLDDSISGKQWVARLTSKEGGWVFTEATNRWSCQRGGGGAEWVTTPCP
jgi:hypothetical protein